MRNAALAKVRRGHDSTHACRTAEHNVPVTSTVRPRVTIALHSGGEPDLDGAPAPARRSAAHAFHESSHPSAGSHAAFPEEAALPEESEPEEIQREEV